MTTKTTKTTDTRLVTADNQKFSLYMQNGIDKTDFYKWIATKTKNELVHIRSQCSLFFNELNVRFELSANNHYVDGSATSGYESTAKLVINSFRKAWLQETIADPYLQNESAKHIWIGLELTPKINMLSDKSQSDVMALILDNNLIKTRMKADEVTPEFYSVFSRDVLGSITKIQQGYTLPRPNHLHNVISTDLLMQVEMDLGVVDERDLHEGLLMNGVVGKTLLETQQIQQAIATLKIQGAWGTKDGIAKAIHDNFKKQVDALIAEKGATFKADIVEELRIINDINNVYAEIDSLTDIYDTTQMYWKGFYQNLVLPLLRYDYKQIALGDREDMIIAFWKANGWTGTEDALKKIVDRQIAENLRRKRK